MSTVTLDEVRLKETLKDAMREVLEEQRDVMRDIIEEALEDIALARAIQEGEHTPLVGRDVVFKALEAAR